MADQKISELTALTGANVADDDAIAIVDTSATETKKIVFSELKNALDTATGFVRITGDTMTGALDVQSTITADGLTVDASGTPASLNRTDGNAALLELKTSGSVRGYIGADTTGSTVFYSGAAAERMRIDSSGHAIIPAGVTLGTSVGVYNAANTLDDYEEGTFTPTAFGTSTAGTTTYAAQTGSYTKVGDTVNLDIFISWSAMTGTGNLRIGGLPFTSSSASNYFASGTVVPLFGFTWPSGMTQLNPIISASDTAMNIYGSATDLNSTASSTDNELVGLAISLTYKV